MTGEDMIRNHVRSEFLKLGYSERDSNEVAANAIRKFRRNTNNKIAIADAIKEGKKFYKRVKK